ncbi:hypothetical protein trd_1328 [Thermomicrobium roseum DSM 5159]|uniref:Uncharacterized protein n=1 Tax=Thermomicrobium roseum (strain ATCC 27502 / DSM 5159 / P-2) TaxID=309801 RepID=B9L2C6_THERP|nr:hypothetical protein trd_1328 [Thermomicrobium roseum DSM 5159]
MLLFGPCRNDDLGLVRPVRPSPSLTLESRLLATARSISYGCLESVEEG